MSVSAIIMMCIACIGLWGGVATAAIIMVKSNKKKAAQVGSLLDDSYMMSVAGDRREMGHEAGTQYSDYGKTEEDK